MCFVACGGTSRRHGAGGSGKSGMSAAAGSGSGSSVAGSGSSVGGSDSSVGGSRSSVGGSRSSVGGFNGAGATGGAFSGGGTPGTGEGGDGTAQSGAPGQAGKSSSPITSCAGDFPFLGTWDGSILDFYFEPRAALSLHLVENADDEVVGTLTWTSGDAPPPPTSADEPWPPGYWPTDGAGGRGDGAPETLPGFPYTVVRGASCDAALRFSIASTEAWQDWCALQTPLYTEGSGWSCIRGNGATSDGTACTTQENGKVLDTYPMWKCAACGIFGPSVCACDENGCGASDDPTHVFDLALGTSGGTEVLSGKDATCPDCTVRLERQ